MVDGILKFSVIAGSSRDGSPNAGGGGGVWSIASNFVMHLFFHFHSHFNMCFLTYCCESLQIAESASRVPARPVSAASTGYPAVGCHAVDGGSRLTSHSLL